MDDCDAVFVGNLPLRLTLVNFTSSVLDVFKKEMLGPYQRNELIVQLFEVKDKKRVAVISGFRGNFEEMKDKCETWFLEDEIGKEPRRPSIKKDFEEDRDEFGSFLRKRSGFQKRELMAMTGSTTRKIFKVFRPGFLHQLNWKVFNAMRKGNIDPAIYLSTTEFDDSVLRMPGKLHRVTPNDHHQSTIVIYSTALEVLQAIRFLNHNPALHISSPVWRSIGGDESTCNDRKGLGKDGLLTIQSYEQGCVPFADFDERILNPAILKSQVDSFCWRCEDSYQLKGVSKYLTYVTGVCSCKYESSLDILDKKRAYYWEGEQSTRLILGQDKKDLTLIICHTPLRYKYISVKEYRDIVLPVINEEWKFCSQTFKHNSASGSVTFIKHIETLFSDEGIPKSEPHGLILSLPETKFWSSSTTLSIKRVSMDLLMDGPKGQMRTFPVRGTIRKMHCLGGKILLHVWINCTLGWSPKCPQTVLVVPKPDKTNYSSMKHAVRKLYRSTQDEGDNNWCNSPLVRTFIHKRNDCWSLETTEIVKNKDFIFVQRALIEKLSGMLNHEQKKFVLLARMHSLSICQGPPGTGKSRTAAILASWLSITEEGFVVVATPTNFAADQITKYLNELSEVLMGKVKVIRVFSKTRESMMTWAGNQQQYPYPTLHNLVTAVLEKEEDLNLAELFERYRQGDDFLFKKVEKDLLNARIKEIEKQIIAEQNIIVMTLGTLNDSRMESWTKIRPVTTVIHDEAGELQHPQTLAPLPLEHKRSVYFGDHEQLQPCVLSYAAKVAGLNIGWMEFMTFGSSACKPPWTTLVEQYRMHPSIREIVSNLTYDGSLKDGPSIASRVRNIPIKLMDALPQLKETSVLVYDHTGPETAVERAGFFNVQEAEIVVNAAVRFMQFGIDASRITVLSLYEAQKQAIIGKMPIKAKGVAVCNVDSFQGKENDVIILSMVRSNAEGILGFTKELNRLNVAISRAREILFIAMDRATFAKDTTKHCKDFLDLLQKNANCVVW